MPDLRNHLFATLEALQDEDNPMDLDRARTIADVAQVLVHSAKVEVDYLKDRGVTAPVIQDEAYLNFLCLPQSTLAATAIHGMLRTAWN